MLERQSARVLDVYADNQEAGRWARSIVGIGPIISAGLIANIAIKRKDKDGNEVITETAGEIWRFAGLDPTVKWEKETKRPWNASLKRLCFIIGESFTKFSNHENDIYGKIYKARKVVEVQRNEAGLFAEQAALALKQKKFRDDKEAKKHYLAGKLPPARVHLRAQRYATKFFLSHYHHVAYEIEFGTPPPKPYILTHGDHAHYIGPPNWPMT